jgi:hypothetical protein
MADYVYLALPREVTRVIKNPTIFEKLNIGLLEFSVERVGRRKRKNVMVIEKFIPEPSEIVDKELIFYQTLARLVHDSIK